MSRKPPTTKSRSLPKVGFQGERGAFSEIAAGKMAPGKVELAPQPNFATMFRSLKSRKIDFAIVPIENTLAGSIHENYDNLLKYRYPILAETTVRIVHNLIALPGVKFRDLKRVYSHPVALLQCRKFFEKHRRQFEAVTFYDTAGSVKMVVEDKLKDAAGIAGKHCAKIYGGEILVENIGDDAQNFTRFLLVGRNEDKKRAAAGTKTSIVLATRNQPGALFRCISVFALRDINLTKVESRPLVGRPWEYLFYLDIAGNLSSPAVANALNHLREIAEFVHVLGCYSTVA